MHILFRKSDLLPHLPHLKRLASVKNSLPILSHVQIIAEKNFVILNATNLENWVSIQLDIDVRKQGALTLPSSALHDVVKALPDKPIHLYTQAEKVCISIIGETAYEVEGMPSEEYPIPPQVKTRAVSIRGEVLRRLIHQTAYAASRDPDRENIATLRFDTEDPSQLKIRGTDSLRAAWSWYEENPFVDTEAFSVPIATIDEVQKVFKSAENIAIAVDADSVIFRDAFSEILARRVKEVYPTFENLLPTETKGELLVDRKAFSETLARVAKLAKDKKKTDILLNIDADRELMKITCDIPNVGKAQETIDLAKIDTVRDGAFRFAYFVLYDAISHFDCEWVTLTWQDSERPVLCSSDTTAQQGALICPKRL